MFEDKLLMRHDVETRSIFLFKRVYFENNAPSYEIYKVSSRDKILVRIDGEDRLKYVSKSRSFQTQKEAFNYFCELRRDNTNG